MIATAKVRSISYQGNLWPNKSKGRRYGLHVGVRVTNVYGTKKGGRGRRKKKIWDESRRLNSGRETSTSRKIFKIKYPKLNLWSTVHGEANWRIRSSGISGQKKRDHQMLVAAQKSAVNKKVYHSSFVKHTLLCCWQKKTNKHRTKARE